MMIELLDTKAQLKPIRQDVDQAIARVLDSGIFVLGPEVARFEEDFCRLHQSSHGIACSSGTAAIHLILCALGIGPGDEVITVSMTFAATVAAIAYTGATPVLIDIDRETWTMDPNLLKNAITKKTKAIMPVHLHGRLADMESIFAIANEYGSPVVEDAAQAHLASRNGKTAGSFGIATAFSFYPGKNLGACGEGGIAVTSDAVLAEKIALLRNWGAKDRYNQESLGFNYRMDAVQGAILGVKLKRLIDWTETRKQIASSYRSFDDLPNVQTPARSDGSDHVYHIFSILVSNPAGVAANLKAEGIATGFHYPIPVHKQRAYEGLVQLSSTMGNTDDFANSCLTIPLHPDMSATDVEKVKNSLAIAVKPA
jgi:dTDP-4-amino-4,6-dideoxygalactose transaminase